jgi:anti-sigma regulatory factor (Ser/Thr protein kinase)
MRRMRTFPAIPQSVHAARRFATGALADSPGATLEAVELMVSELATNCIRHERASFHIAILRTAHQIRVEVTDSGAGTPTMRSPGPDEPSGRGLQIVDMLAQDWGVEPEMPSGKTVWFTLDVATPQESRADGGSRHRHAEQPAPIAGRPPVAHRRQPASEDPSGQQLRRGRYRGNLCRAPTASPVAQGCAPCGRYVHHDELGRNARRRRRTSDATDRAAR